MRIVTTGGGEVGAAGAPATDDPGAAGGVDEPAHAKSVATAPARKGKRGCIMTQLYGTFVEPHNGRPAAETDQKQPSQLVAWP
jgi:hypothetical protein